MTVSGMTTIDDLLAAGDIGRCELIGGKLRRMTPASARHGIITSRLHVALAGHVVEHGVGEVTAAETGFIIGRDPDTVRAPDVAVVRQERLLHVPERGFFQGAPDLAVEVLSPDDRRREVMAKATAWLSAGAAEVWLVDPETRRIAIHRSGSDAPVAEFTEAEVLRTDELPGLAIALADVFK